MLKLRRQREDQQKRVVADRLAQIVTVEQELAQLADLTQQGIEAVRSMQQDSRLDIEQTMVQRRWVTHLQQSAINARARMRELEIRLAQERTVLAEASKQRRIIEKLKERQMERHHQEELRAETRMADDLTTTRYVFEGIESMT